ncbi:MAG TPA: hypothetical protein EYP17_02425 [Candidatus Latescibacteria bacterium]|nr:hypothetical protein [Candidatus Latescibacterota bacterium]
MERKLVVIGLDSLVPTLTYRFVKKGVMPYFEKLMEKGTYGRAIPSFPTHTPTNWTTIATGADVFLHGVDVFRYDTRLRKAESIWQAVERQSGCSVLLRYPGTWPRDFSSGVIFDQGGNLPSFFRLAMAQMHLVGERVEYVGGMHGTVGSMGVELSPARGWKDIPDATPAPLEGEISVRTDDDRRELLRLFVLLLPERGRYRKVLINNRKDCRNPLCILREGGWSDFLVHTFQWKGKRVKAAFRFKLMLLSPRGDRLRLYRSEVYPVEGFSYPEGITEELYENCGPYVGTPGRILLGAGWMETYFEEAKDHVEWLVRAARHLMETRGPDLFMMECHFPDFIEHKFWSLIDPESDEYNPRNSRRYWDIFRTTYFLVDGLVGGISEALGEDTVLVVVSDHGHCLKRRSVLVENALADAGVLDPENPEDGEVRVDSFNILISQRIGKSSPEYESLRNRVVEVLHGIIDEERGAMPVAMVLRREEAPLLGLSPSSVGDLVFCLRAGYETAPYRGGIEKGGYVVPPSIGKWGTTGGTHGLSHPTSSYSLGDMHAFFLFSGPGVRKGLFLPHPIHLKDVIPTSCLLTGMDSPRHANGGVVRDILE